MRKKELFVRALAQVLDGKELDLKLELRNYELAQSAEKMK
jgi:hypothetical protein